MNINEKMRQVPFGHSVFQITNFATNHETPERSYRNILIQLDSKMKAMNECVFRRRRREIDLAEFNEKISTAEGYEKQRLQVSIDEIIYGLEEEEKLIEDCAIEIKVYEKLLGGLPEYTREDFEKGEFEYWEKRLIGDAQRELTSSNSVGVGTIDALGKIGILVGKDDSGQFCITKTPQQRILNKEEKTPLPKSEEKEDHIGQYE